MGLSRQEYWSELPCLAPGDFLDPGTEMSLLSPALAGGFFLPLAPPGVSGSWDQIRVSLTEDRRRALLPPSSQHPVALLPSY